MCIDEFQSLPQPAVACADLMLEPRVNVDELTRTVEEPEESIVAVFFFGQQASGTQFPVSSRRSPPPSVGLKSRVC